MPDMLIHRESEQPLETQKLVAMGKELDINVSKLVE